MHSAGDIIRKTNKGSKKRLVVAVTSRDSVDMLSGLRDLLTSPLASKAVKSWDFSAEPQFWEWAPILRKSKFTVARTNSNKSMIVTCDCCDNPLCFSSCSCKGTYSQYFYSDCLDILEQKINSISRWAPVPSQMQANSCFV